MQRYYFCLQFSFTVTGQAFLNYCRLGHVPVREPLDITGAVFYRHDTLQQCLSNDGNHCSHVLQLKFLVIMVALWNRGRPLYFLPCGFYLSFFFSFFLSFFSFFLSFPRLISAAADWMSTILGHVLWPQCEFMLRSIRVVKSCSRDHVTPVITSSRLANGTHFNADRQFRQT